MAKKRITELATETTLKDGQYVAIDHATDGTKKLNLGAKLTNLKEEINDALEPETTIINLYRGGLISGKLWNCWSATVSQDSNANYSCFEFDIPTGTEYISANLAWPDNSYSAYVDDNYSKIDLIKNQKQSDNGYVYAVPSGATKACVSFNSSNPTDLNTKGLLFISGRRNISNEVATNYPDIIKYFADALYLQGNGTVADFKADIDTFGFIIRKNLVTELNEGKYCESWNIGDSVTINSNAQYAYGYADVEGLEKITINLPHISDAFSFFTTASRKKVSTIASCQVGSTRVYTVPDGAKYVYVSSNYDAEWGEYGLVIFSGNDDITTNPASAEIYPYGTKVAFADNLKLSNGNTLIKSVNSSRVYRVEKDGSGDFTSFVEAINEATKYMDSLVYVGAGTFDLLEELGNDYIQNPSSSKKGVVLKNRVHVICSSQTILEMNNTGTVFEYLSPINTGVYGCTLENATIIDNGARYSVHDDLGDSGSTPYINRFINCTMIHKNGKYGDCIGGGLGENGEIEIRGCYFEGDSNIERLVYYHGNNNASVTDAKCRLVVADNYFSNVGTFKMTKYGQSTEVSTAYVSNNSFGSAPVVDSGSVAPYDNVAIVAWNNEIRS